MAARVGEAMKVLLRKNSFGGFLSDKLHLVNASKGKVCCELEVEENHQNHIGSLHGGLSATLVDIVSTLALHSTGDNPGYGVSTDMNVTFLAAGALGSTIVIESEVLRLGRKMAFLTVDIRDKNTGKLLVQGRHTKYFLSN